MSWSERAGKIFCILSAVVGIFIIIKYALLIVLPFLIAWGLAMLTKPIARRISRSLRIHSKICSVTLTLLFLGAFGGLIYLAINRIIFESERLFTMIGENSERIGEIIGSFLDKLSSIGDRKSPLLESLLKIEQFKEFRDNIDSVIASVITSTVTSLTEWIPGALLGFIKRLPELMIFILITVISCFYFSSDIDSINRYIITLFPKNIQSKIPIIKEHVFTKLSGYVRAYFLLLIMTFGELLVAFLILRIPYPFLLAMLISILDILPVLGVGTTLIPWAIVEILIARDLYTGIGLFIVYAIITVVRQISEPKIIAGSLGLPPLLTLISMYVGLKLFGFWGIMIAPFSVIVIRTVTELSSSGSTLDTKTSL